MNVLWISNIVFPEAECLLKGESIQKGGGGWMFASAQALITHKDLHLYVATVSKAVHELTTLVGKSIVYYLIPYGKGNTKYNSNYNHYWIKIKELVNPDVVHIHGTEYTHGLSYIKACGPDNVVVSIQGLKFAYSHYYHYGISIKEIFCNFTIRNLFDGGIIKENWIFKKTGKYEKELIKSVNHIIGRTSWDRSRTWAINPSAEYHYCNETLRSEFYTGKWEYENCEKHTIFMSQGHYPIKGLHMILKALAIVRTFYPDVLIKVAGSNETRSSSFWDKIKLSNYGSIIRKTISANHLQNNVRFLGALDEGQMKKEYLNANLYVCSSSIENSPNSLGEAQLLGVPCICSYVGGTMDMIPNSDCGELYRFEEYEMLAYKICDLFEKSKSFDNTVMRETAMVRHHVKHNAERLLSIYGLLVNS